MASSERGFAGMDVATKRRIAAMGGRKSHEMGKAHEFTSEEARIAGRKGGAATWAKRRALSESKNQNAIAAVV